MKDERSTAPTAADTAAGTVERAGTAGAARTLAPSTAPREARASRGTGITFDACSHTSSALAR